MAELFRKSALDTMATPEQLDKQVKIVRPSTWMLSIILVIGLITLILWSFTYHITDGVNAEGVVFSNQDVVQIKSTRDCIVTDVLVLEGEHVEIGDIIAVVSDEEKLQEIEEAKAALAELETGTTEYEASEEKLSDMVDTYVASTMIKSSTNGYIQSVISDGNALQRGENIAIVMPDSGYNEVISYVSIQTVQKLKVGMEVQVSPVYAPREEYGYMTGVITSISKVPITTERILEHMGTLSYVENVLPDTSCVEVKIQLNLDVDSKNNYSWSNEKGKNLSVETGTRCSVIIVTDEYKPIELLLE